MPLSDADLVARVILDDDHHAFAELVRRHQSSVRGMLRKLTSGNEALADDLAQQTFIRAYRSMKNYRGEGQLTTWLYRIAYNQFKTEIARSRPHEISSPEEAETVAASETASAGFQTDLQHALRKLGDDERAAVVLCLVNGCTHEEAADILKMPLGTVKTHMLRGKEKLKQTLAAWQTK